jgi:hypothetical protein
LLADVCNDEHEPEGKVCESFDVMVVILKDNVMFVTLKAKCVDHEFDGGSLVMGQSGDGVKWRWGKVVVL